MAMSITEKKRVFLGLGGNLGEPLNLFVKARQRLQAHPQIDQLKSSALYRTPPVGGPKGQPDYLNAVLEFQTELRAEELLVFCQTLEHEAGRVREVHWGPRTLDIDVLFYADAVFNQTELTLPHPQLHLRRFVLEPLKDLAPEYRHPQLDKTVDELLVALPVEAGLTCIKEIW
jgi:2-amino-4-hydroxy-6-hydroxymethyldihydropteridine diphosphokinase